MKKCTAIIFYSALFLLFSCTGSKKDGSIQVAPSKAEPIVTDTIHIHEKYTYAYSGEEAPTLTVDICLPIVKAANAAATAKIDSALAISLFDEHTTLKNACNKFVNSRKKDFDDMHDEYINSKANDVPALFFSQYDIINGTIQSGYKDCITYIVAHEGYYGGAHPNTFINITNFDPVNGDEITLNDIFKEGYEEQLITILTNELMKEANATTIEELRNKGFLFFDTEMFVSNNFILSKENITFLYNRYEIAPYAYGEILLTIDYNTLKEIMK